MWPTFVPKTHLSRAAIQFLLGWQGPDGLMPASPCWGPWFWPLSAGPVPPLTRQLLFFCSATFYLKMNGKDYTFEGQSRENAHSSVFQAAGSVRLRKVLSQRDSAEGHGARVAATEQARRAESGLPVLLHTQAQGWVAGLSARAGGLGRLPEGAPPAFRGCP